MAAFHILPTALVISLEKHQLPNFFFFFFFKLTFYAFFLYDPDLKIIGLKYELPHTFGEDLK